MRVMVVLLFLLSSVLYGQESYGISSVYQDTRSKEWIYDFSMYSPVKVDSVLLFEWSSYSYYWRRELMSKQWGNYWITKDWAIGMEVELWYTTNRGYEGTRWKLNTLYVTPRIGVQYRWW